MRVVSRQNNHGACAALSWGLVKDFNNCVAAPYVMIRDDAFWHGKERCAFLRSELGVNAKIASQLRVCNHAAGQAKGTYDFLEHVMRPANWFAHVVNIALKTARSQSPQWLESGLWGPKVPKGRNRALS